MTAILPPLAALLLVPAFAFFDRWVGKGSNGRTLPMLTAILGGGLIAQLTIPSPNYAFAFVGAFWAAHRSIGFFHNSLAPATTQDRLAATLRYALQIPGPTLLAYWAHGPYQLLTILLVAQASIATALRIDFGRAVARHRAVGTQFHGDPNAAIEITSGAGFGAALAAYAILAPHLS